MCMAHGNARTGFTNWYRYVRSQVRLDLSEEDACDAFELELESCYRDNSKKIDETGRRVAKILAKDDTVHQTELLRQARSRTDDCTTLAKQPTNPCVCVGRLVLRTCSCRHDYDWVE